MKRIRILLILLFSCSLVVVVFFACSKLKCTPRSKKVVILTPEKDLHNLKVMMDLYLIDYGRVPRLSKYGNVSSNNSNIVLIMLGGESTIAKKENPRGTRYLRMGKRLQDGILKDIWGSPYNILVADDGEIVVGESKIAGDYAIWSSGANRRNEYGEGDDICSWK